jgi:hypothetical protein
VFGHQAGELEAAAAAGDSQQFKPGSDLDQQDPICGDTVVTFTEAVFEDTR